MNALPESRRIINGRTHSSVWDARHFDPFEAHRAPPYSTADWLIAAGLVATLIGFFVGVM